MRNALCLAVFFVLAACATSRPDIDKEAVDDFVVVRELQEVDRIRTEMTDGYYELNQHYVIYQTRKGDYLFQFARRCWQLDEREVTPDVRRAGKTIRARFDTLRGCRIHKIFGLTETESEELRQLGEAPGNRN